MAGRVVQPSKSVPENAMWLQWVSARKKDVSKAEDGEKLLARQLKEKPLAPPKADDPYWGVSEEYLEELVSRVEAGVKGE